MNEGPVSRVTLFLLRVVAGFTFSCHGMQKLFGAFGGLGPMGRAHFFSLLWLAGVLEFFGGVLLMIGLFVRPVAFILGGEMAVAYFMVHFPHGFWPIKNMGELPVLYCFIWLFFAAHGGGPWGLDAKLFRRPTGSGAGKSCQ
jgi:putative oxidoreductase